MKKIIGLFLLIFLLGQLSAQQDPKAKKVLDDLANKTRTYTSMKAEFTIGLENMRDNVKEEFAGSILMKGDKYRLSAMGSETIFDGNTIYTYLEEVGEVYISSPEESENSILSDPSKLFTIYQDDFKYRYIADVNEGGKRLSEIDLYPNDLKQQFSRIKLFVDKDKLQVHSAMVYGKDGNTYVFVIKSFQTNLNIRDTEFIFDKDEYPGVEVIDMRF
jgi:outer membrane lipoprotein-sorting protein